jgi:phosphomannomutase
VHRLIAFDLDDTLAHSKSAMAPEMAVAFGALVDQMPVCIISGGTYQQFEDQVLTHLPAAMNRDHLHLMPTCGTKYLRWREDAWSLVYSNELSEEAKAQSVAAVEEVARALDLWDPEAAYGPLIEDRGSQVTFSALGQKAPFELKREWDPTGTRREALRAGIAERLPTLEVRAGGSTSIDITLQGVDKAYGLRKLAEELGLDVTDIHFVGDRLEPGGNDFPVIALGVSVHAVTGPEETRDYIESSLIQA